MASDNLGQVGKRLRRTKDDTRFVTRNVSRNHPVIEESEDIVGSINTYIFEFKTYTENASVHLDVTIKQKFRALG
jgi:hypothetical protein